jgi:chorismate--pyruvate lyase
MLFPRWQAAVNAAECSAALRGWLLDRGSLTRRLQQHSDGDFSVTLLRQRWARPRLDEAQALGISARRHALIREVLLCGHGQPWVFARSVIPAQAMQGPLCFLRRLDNRPLGALLFSNPAITRGPIMLARWPQQLLPPSLQHTGAAKLWGRHSVFHHAGAGILVAEVFLPALALQLPHANT